MKLASLKNGRDGTLIVVDHKREYAVEVLGIAINLLQALENWSHVEPQLKIVSEAINIKGRAESRMNNLRADQKRTSSVIDVAAVQRGMTKLSKVLKEGEVSSSFELNERGLAAALPRAPQFVDGSAYLAHVERVRKARGAEMPPSFLSDPLMYQAVSDGFLAPTEPIRMVSEDYGIDFESEVGVVVDDVP
ncbi:MAG: hypothetical protein ACRESA_03895, partial [Gammaproteobacteria bacterium]